MGQFYRHLTKEDRIVIRTLMQEGRSKQYIADLLGRALSTIKREIRRNSGLRGYRPKQAQEIAESRRSKPQYSKITPEVILCIEGKLSEKFSPEQISEFMERNLGVQLSTERIYQYVWQDKRDGGTLYTNLRIANGQRHRKRYGKKDWRGRIPGRIGIENRPVIVERKKRIGDWEADLVSGSRHRGFLVTLVERKSKFTLIGHVEKKTAEAVRAEIIRLMQPNKRRVHTITYDNGREFSFHAEVNAALGCRSYFAHPYHSWERGLNENTNGLLRQYFPKNSDLRKVDRDKLSFVQQSLNRRPRKTLDFKTPEEVFLKVG